MQANLEHLQLGWSLMEQLWRQITSKVDFPTALAVAGSGLRLLFWLQPKLFYQISVSSIL
jgi:hypothetical protein